MFQPCQEGWQRPALSLFAKVSLVFSCKLAKVAYFQNFFNESLFCDDFLSTHQLLYSNGAFFTPDGRMVDPMPLRCEIFERMREYVGANLARKVSHVVD